tara:strand:+ start:52729 stop:53790 length:1062 start_codon:yes stop_codon:yes gene_type:complete
MTDETQEKPKPQFQFEATRNLAGWLATQQVSLAFTTYQTGKLFFVGLQDNGRLSIYERTYNRCMGLCTDEAAEVLYMSSLFQMWRFTPAFKKGAAHEGYDRLYIPQVGHTTGDVDIHDIAIRQDGSPVFVSTMFSCVAELSDDFSINPIWQPPWISKLAAEDRCHLNGLALEDGAPRYVTSVSQADAVDGWREHRAGGGVLFDIKNDDVVLGGLSMPHSPRVYRGKVWLLDSGTGYFGYADESGRFERVAFCPGFLRGLAFIGNYAVVGMSQGRHNKTFSGLPLDDHLAERKTEGRCGIQIIDLDTGDIVHGIRLGGIVEELYDVVVLRGVKRPMALGFMSDEIRRVITLPES